MIVQGRLIDIFKREIYPAQVETEGKRIKKISSCDSTEEVYIIPGLIDAHIHIESSMLTPGYFALSAVSRGTTGVVADPHEIANVLGRRGVDYMINDAEKVPLKFYFGAPSCVPATGFESSGAVLGPDEIEALFREGRVRFLAEMMNFPGVVAEDGDVMRKIAVARSYNRVIDGHAPGLSGVALKKYIDSGISTDHECTSLEEAKEKIKLGMKVIIREGSAARNLDSLKNLITSNPEDVMLCSDDLHLEMLTRRHLDRIVADLITQGFDIFDVIKCCTLNPVKHYGLDNGLLREGDPADFIIVNNPGEMKVISTWIDGDKVFDEGKTLFSYKDPELVNNFNCKEIDPSMIRVKRGGRRLRLIEAYDGQLLTGSRICDAGSGEFITADQERDILKIVVKDRYRDAPAATAFIRGFGIKDAAFASSVAHDSHNIICTGTSDEYIVTALNEVIRMKGGMSVVSEGITRSFPLPVAGIMSDLPAEEVASGYQELSECVRKMGCAMAAPFMTLSFMALLVIPELKLSDKGLFDTGKFSFVPLFTE